MHKRTVRDDRYEEMKAKKRLLDAGVKPSQLADYSVFRDVHVFAHGSLHRITKLDVDWYNHTFRSGLLANAT